MTEDKLVAAYLRRLRRAARRLPSGQRRELIDHITEYIAESRAADSASGEAGLRSALERLGEPEDIVGAEGRSVRGGRPGGVEITAVLLLLLGGVIIALVGVLFRTDLGIYGLVASWVSGFILLWASPRWRWPDKLLGTLVWPDGLAAVFMVLAWMFTSPHGPTCTAGSSSADGGEVVKTVCTGGRLPPVWLMISAAVAFAAAPILVAIRLLRRARQVSESEEAVEAGIAAR